MIFQSLISRDKSPIIRKKFSISNSFANDLNTSYKINGKWTQGANFLRDFNISLERFFNENDYCITNSKSFKFRVSRRKQQSKGKDMINRTSLFKHTFYFSFLVESKKV